MLSSAPRRHLPPVRGPASALRPLPPIARPSFAPRRRVRLKPPLGRPLCAAASRPPLPGLPRRGAARRYAGPSPLARLGGWPPPLRPLPRRWRGVARPAPGAGHSSPRRHPDTLRGRDPRPGSGWCSLAFARSPPPRPRARREDRRGSSRRSAALFRPAGFGWGRARLLGLCLPIFNSDELTC